MRIKRIHVKNFRSILDEHIDCDSLTALVGRNGSGKSSFLNALELFYDSTGRINQEDFYSQDVTQNVEITITFTDLSTEANDLFSAYIDNEELIVVRVFSDPSLGKSGTYHGTRLQNPDFTNVRGAGGSMDIRRAYNEIRKTEEYKSLPTAGSVEIVRNALAQWEEQNPTRCTSIRDDGQFFGFTQVGQGYLGKHTQVLRIPAVRDAHEDATEGRNSPVTEIMNLVVRSVLEGREDFTLFKHQTYEQYKEILNPQKLTELNSLASDLSETLKSYVPDAGVLLEWSELLDITIPLPRAHVKLLEDEYETEVERTGHGLQRAFIVTMLQHLLVAREKQSLTQDKTASEHQNLGTGNIQLPNLVLAIEEPELYQHPSRQRHLASVLLKLAEGAIPGVAKSTQVLYTTHSPLFVGLDRFDQIRVLRKTTGTIGCPKVTRVKKADMEKIATEIGNKQGKKGKKFTSVTLRTRLQAVMTPWMNEGFFADLVVLVEGEGDRAAILGAAYSLGYDLDALGITVIPCFGKANLDRPLVIFSQLAIPVFVVWDGDYGVKDSKPEDNKYLLRLLGQTEQDWPEFVGNSSACFKINLEKTLESEIGSDFFNKLLNEAREDLGIVKKYHALKNPVIIKRVLTKATAKRKNSPSLMSIVENIVALKAQATTPKVIP